MCRSCGYDGPQGPGEYFCLYCGRMLIGEPVTATVVDAGASGWVFIHDDVPHPAEATYDEDERPQ